MNCKELLEALDNVPSDANISVDTSLQNYECTLNECSSVTYLDDNFEPCLKECADYVVICLKEGRGIA